MDLGTCCTAPSKFSKSETRALRPSRFISSKRQRLGAYGSLSRVHLRTVASTQLETASPEPQHKWVLDISTLDEYFYQASSTTSPRSVKNYRSHWNPVG